MAEPSRDLDPRAPEPAPASSQPTIVVSEDGPYVVRDVEHMRANAPTAWRGCSAHEASRSWKRAEGTWMRSSAPFGTVHPVRSATPSTSTRPASRWITATAGHRASRWQETVRTASLVRCAAAATRRTSPSAAACTGPWASTIRSPMPARHAAAILARLRDGSMPCDGPWPPERVEVFARWVDSELAA